MTSVVRSSLHSYEQGLPHPEVLAGLYSGIGDMATRIPRLPTYQQPIAEALLRDNEFILPGSDFYQKMEEVAHIQDPYETFQAQFTIGAELGSAIVDATTSPRSRMLSFLNASFQADKLWAGVNGLNLGMNYKRHVQAFMQRTIVDSLPIDVGTHASLQMINETVQELIKVDPIFVFVGLNAQVFMQEYENRAYATIYEEKIQDRIADADTPEQNVAETEKMAAEIVAGKRYSLKPAYIPASVGGTWLFYDGPTYAESSDTSTVHSAHLDTPAAVVWHSKKTAFADIRLDSRRDDNGRKTPILKEEVIEEIQPDWFLYITKSGKLTIDYDGLRDLRTEFQDDAAYQHVLAELVSCYFDLTTSVSHIKATGVRNYTQLDAKEKQNYNPILDLLLPRFKALSSTSPHSLESDNAAIPVPRDASKKKVRQHPVVGHPMQLPEGWKPSPAALALAKLHGVKLEPNETYVRPHERGTNHPVTGHKIVKRLLEASDN